MLSTVAKPRRAAPSAPADERTEPIQVSADRAYAAAATLAPHLHRIAPHEEVVLDADALQARFAQTDEARIAAALDAHDLHADFADRGRADPPGLDDGVRRAPPRETRRSRAHEPTHQIRRRRRRPAPVSWIWILTLGALGLAAGIGAGLLGP
jgi:hypothetical protein